MFSASSPLQATSLDDYIAQFVASGGRIDKCPPMPAMGDLRPDSERKWHKDGERKPPMAAELIDAIPATLPNDRARMRRGGRKNANPAPTHDNCPDLARRIAAMVSGKTHRQVAVDLKVTVHLIRSQLRIARRHGITVPSYAPAPNQRDHELERAVLAAVAAGNSYAGTGLLLGIHKSRVGQIVRRARAEAAAQEERHGR